MKFEKDNMTVRRRKKAKKVEVADTVVWAAQGEWMQVLRLLLFALVSVVALAATLDIGQEWLACSRGTAEECRELREMDVAAKRLGLDGMPGYVEACFTARERLWMAAEPFTRSAAAVLSEAVRRLHRIRLRLVRRVTFAASEVVRRLHRIRVRLVRGTDRTRDGTEVIRHESRHPGQGIGEDPQEGDEEVLLLTKGSLKDFATRLGRLLGKELDEEATEALVQSLASQSASRGGRAGEL